MILASFLDIGINLIFVAQLIVTILLLIVVLMQRPKQEGLGAAFGAALTDQAFGARTTDVLKKATIYLGTLFMLIAFVLCILLNRKYKENQPTLSQVENAPSQVEKTDAPKDEKKKSVMELLQEQQQKQDKTPAPTPAEPATPAPAEPASTPAKEPGK